MGMSCYRFNRRTILASSFALMGGSVALLAQTQTPPPTAPTAPDNQQSQPAPAPSSVPPATQVPASSVPSVPGYQDPLLSPVNVGPGAATPPVKVPPPASVSSLPSFGPYDLQPLNDGESKLSSTYIPVDSPIYPMALRLYSLGYLDTAFINLRPWTRLSLLHMLNDSHDQIMAEGNPQAVELLAKLTDYVSAENPTSDRFNRGTIYGVNTVYTRLLGITGQTLRDSYHLGQTIVNDYGRPYQAGFNNITGFSTINEMGRFSLYVRGEYQHSPAGIGYSTALTAELANIDGIPYPGTNNEDLNQATIPTGPIAAQNPFRLQEAVLSFHILGHEISGGKSDDWIGPGLGGGMAWSNNAEDIYSFRINRVEPMHIPLLSHVIGPIRYDFFVGSLKGHVYPNEPWVHQETVSAAPTPNLQFGFQRTVIWGGHGHPCLIPGTVSSTTPCGEPINLHTFLKSFFSFNDTTGAVKLSSDDPGARYSDFYFSWRLPYMHHYVTLYTDSICHDDVTPISAPRRAAYRPGVYISQFPHLPKLDFRIEGANTDTSTTRSTEGEFNYYENVQKQGYTNKGFIMGDWVGRQAKGGQAWLTWHLSGNEWVQAEYRYMKVPRDFVPGGTSQDQLKIELVKRLHKDIELDAWYQYERWKAPVPQITGNNSFNVTGGPLYYANAQTDNVIAAQITWYPKLHSALGLRSK